MWVWLWVKFIGTLVLSAGMAMGGGLLPSSQAAVCPAQQLSC